MRHSRTLWSGIFAFAMAAGCESVEPWEGEPDVYEGDASRSSAKELRIHAAPVTHTFSPDGDEDWIRVRVERVDLDETMDEYGPIHWFALSNVQGSTVIELFDPSDTSLGSGNEWLQATLVTPGIYHLRVGEANGSGGQYDVKVAVGTYCQSGGSATADLVLGTVTLPSEVGQGATVSVPVMITNQGDLMVTSTFSLALYASADRIFDTAVDTLLGTTSVSGIEALSWSVKTVPVNMTPAGSGPVYVLARVDSTRAVGELDDELSDTRDSSNNVFYGSTLIVPTVGDLKDVDEGELGNDDELTASDWDGTPRLDRTFHVADDVDVYAFDAVTGLRYEIWTERLRGDADTRVQIYRGDFSTVVGDNDDGGAENFASYVAFVPAAAELHYAVVTNTRAGSGAYDLLMRTGASSAAHDTYEPDDYDVADCVRPWKALHLGTEVVRSLGTVDDVDWMVYNVKVDDHQKNHSIKTYGVGAGLFTNLKLYRSTSPPSSGRLVVTMVGTPGAHITPQLDAGMYYLKIEADSLSTNPGAYTLLAESPTVP